MVWPHGGPLPRAIYVLLGKGPQIPPCNLLQFLADITVSYLPVINYVILAADNKDGYNILNQRTFTYAAVEVIGYGRRIALFLDPGRGGSNLYS